MTEKNDVKKDGGIKKVIFVSAGQYEHKKQTSFLALFFDYSISNIYPRNLLTNALIRVTIRQP